MKKLTLILLLTSVIIIIADNVSMAQRFRLEEADNTNIEVKFDAFRVNDQIQFVWNVNLENNIRSYEIIRGSENGRFLDWEILNRANVNKQLDGTYTFTDNSPVLGEMHYRLRLVAPDGSNVEYSPLFKLSNQIVGTAKKK